MLILSYDRFFDGDSGAYGDENLDILLKEFRRKVKEQLDDHNLEGETAKITFVLEVDKNVRGLANE